MVDLDALAEAVKANGYGVELCDAVGRGATRWLVITGPNDWTYRVYADGFVGMSRDGIEPEEWRVLDIVRAHVTGAPDGQ